jgi:cytochrome P450/NADPH-cytochrome P450 reductase
MDHPDVDLLYREELEGWASEGIVEVYTAFYRLPDGEVTFVQHRVRAEAARVRAAVADGAVVYLCGDGRRMAPGVREAFDAALGPEGRAALVAEGRWREDIFAG